jgi:tetratricopeptide (TPR) repeat protein
LVLGGILLLCLGINNSSRLASTLVLVQNNGPNPQLGQIQTGPLALSHNLELPEQLREANPKTRRFLDQGLTYFQRSDFAGAMVAYKTAWPTRPNSPEVLFRRGQVHFALRDYPRAIEDYTQVLKLNPGFAPAYSGRAEVYSDLALYPQAIQDYDQALRLDRQNGQVYFNRGGVYLAQGRQSEAIQDFQQTLLLDTDVTLRAKTFFNRGVGYLLSGKRETGLRDLRQASTLFKGLGNLYAHRMAEQMIQQAEN